MRESPFYVTTPIYYVNDRPHIGHAYTTILADVLARYHRLLDHPTFFLTGTDEHGQKVQRAAEKHGITPQEQCDRTVVRFQELWHKLEITHDQFIRTTDPAHKRIVQSILADLYERGEIYAAEYEGWYCVPCERFYTEKDLLQGNCPECGRAVERLLERNYFFRMSQYQEWLIDYINENPQFIQPEHRRQETLGFLRQPLTDLCISRPKSRLNWGIDLPFDPEYVTYVWFDALVNYISAIGYGTDAERFQRWWPAQYHLIGKDILTTHTVYWPTMLKAMGIDLPRTVFAHGWWLLGRDKMSKSRGNVVNPMDMATQYGVDAFRYFLLAEMTLGQDAGFTEQGFVNRYNSELANDLGNLASRVLTMIQRHCDGRIPAAGPPGTAETALVRTTQEAVHHMRAALAAMKLDKGLAEVMGAVREANRYFEQNAPWELAKQGRSDDLARVLYNAAECLRVVSGLLLPVMPGKMAELRESLGLAPEQIQPHFAGLEKWELLPANAQTSASDALFPRIERAPERAGSQGQKKAAQSAKAGKAKKKAKPTGPPQEIEMDAFACVQLKTARILAAEPVVGTDKLLRLQIQVGGQTRQIVAGIAQHYRVEDLPGRTIVVVANLQPATIRGVESDGMLLAARNGDQLSLLTVDGDMPSGASVG